MKGELTSGGTTTTSRVQRLGAGTSGTFSNRREVPFRVISVAEREFPRGFKDMV